MDICVDFDGTCVLHAYPSIGDDIGAVPVLKELIEKGHRLILFTMRSDRELRDAVEWFEDNGLDLFGINVNPEQEEWTTSPKAYAQLYIDDCGIGTPLIIDKEKSDRPYVDWSAVRELLIERKVL